MILRRILFSLMSMAAFAAGIYFSFFVATPNYAMTGVWLTFSLFMLALGWPDIAESVSFLGNNIKLREVKNAINELKLLAEVFSKATLELIQGGGRWGGFVEEEKWKTYESIEKMLRGFGFKSAEIEEIQLRWHFWARVDYVHALLHHNINHPEIPSANYPQWHLKRSELESNPFDLTPSDLKQAFQEVGGYTDKMKALIGDFAYYTKHQKHRDLEKWKQRSQWFEPA